MSETIEQARSAQRVRSAAADEAYAELVRQLANGGTPAPEIVLKITEAAGRTLDELNADVATEERRAELRRQLLDEPEVLAAAAKAQADLVAEQRKLDRQLEVGRKKIAALSHEARLALKAVEGINRTKQELRSLSSKYQPSRQTLVTERAELLAKRDRARGVLAEDKAHVQTLETELGRVRQENADALKASLERAKRHLDASTAQCKSLDGAIAAIDGQLATLRAECSR